MCVKNLRFGRVNQRKAQNKSVPGLGGKKVGRRIAAGCFISLITPVVKIIVQLAELFPPGKGTLEFMTVQSKYCQIFAILNLSITGWGNCSSSICSPGFLISPHIHSWGNTVVYNGLPYMQSLWNTISLSFCPSNDTPHHLKCKLCHSLQDIVCSGPAYLPRYHPIHSTAHNGHFAIARIQVNQMHSASGPLHSPFPPPWTLFLKNLCLLAPSLIQVFAKILPSQKDCA